MEKFAAQFRPGAETTILDVGGSPFNWQLIDCDAQITSLNLEHWPDVRTTAPAQFTFVRGDGTRLPFVDGCFDIGYSNSVIEHLFTYEQQQRFAAEMRRSADGLWVQAPARSFPIEPHYLTPLIHFLPKRWQKKLLRNFTVFGLITRPSQPQIDSIVEEIRLVTYDEMKALFPDCLILREKVLFLTKSLIAVRRPRGNATATNGATSAEATEATTDRG